MIQLLRREVDVVNCNLYIPEGHLQSSKTVMWSVLVHFIVLMIPHCKEQGDIYEPVYEFLNSTRWERSVESSDSGRAVLYLLFVCSSAVCWVIFATKMYLKELQLISPHSVRALLCASGCLQTTTCNTFEKNMGNVELPWKLQWFSRPPCSLGNELLFSTCYCSWRFYLLRRKSMSNGTIVI